HQTDTGQPDITDQPLAQNQLPEPVPNAAAAAPQPNSPEQGISDKQREKKKGGDPPPPYTVARSDEWVYGFEVSEEKNNEASGIDREARQVEEMPWGDLTSYTPAAGEEREWRAEIHKRLALPAACLVFALIGVGFGITNVRTGRSFGLLLGLAITIIYYLLALWGQHAAIAGTLPVWLGIWLANLALAVLGIAVVIAQRQPGWDPVSPLSSLRHAFPSRENQGTPQKYNRTEELQPKSVYTASNSSGPIRSEVLPIQSAGRRSVSIRIPQLMDRLVL